MDFHVYVHFDASADRAQLDHVLLNLHQIKHSITTQGASVMKAIDDFVALQTQYNADVSAAISTLSTATDGLTGDIANLNTQIAALITGGTATTLSPEDQGKLAALVATGAEIDSKATALATALAALDALTPPVAPPVV